MEEFVSQSQLGQDLHLISEIYPDKTDGFFIEMGAADGKTLSNTYLLEKKYNWKGLCIEPNPTYHTQLFENRNCHKSTALCHDKSGVEIDFVLADLLSGIREDIDCHKYVLSNQNIKLMTTTLTEILDSIEAPIYIDYFSLDTEGSELNILKGLDMDKYKFGYLSIEHNFQPRRDDIRDFLISKGYLFYRQNNFDDDYISKEVLESLRKI